GDHRTRRRAGVSREERPARPGGSFPGRDRRSGHGEAAARRRARRAGDHHADARSDARAAVSHARSHVDRARAVRVRANDGADRLVHRTRRRHAHRARRQRVSVRRRGSAAALRRALAELSHLRRPPAERAGRHAGRGRASSACGDRRRRAPRVRRRLAALRDAAGVVGDARRPARNDRAHRSRKGKTRLRPEDSAVSDAPILIERPADGVALVRLNRPKVFNALSNALIAELAAAIEGFDTDGATRAVVLTGDERAFAAGADIGEFASTGPRLDEWDRIWNAGVPLIAAVRGLALGGGLELAMSCDLLVVAEDARLGQPEINLGVMPGAGGTQRLTRAVGKTIATEMVLLGRELSGREAEAHGLANRCVPAERVLPVALQLAKSLARQAPHAVRVAKRTIAKAFEQSLHASLLDERRAFMTLLTTEDAREGVRAFLDKRKPAWQGR